MIVELAHFALIMAFAVAIVQTILPLVGAHWRISNLVAVAPTAAILQFMLLALSFAGLSYAFVTSDFSLRLVTLNSHSMKPMLYKISGVWGNHEGSMLLWVMILALFGAACAVFSRNLPATFLARVLAVKGAIGASFLAFVIFTSNPFLRLIIPPFDGQDLNPLLQDPGLAFHPPFLYLGYVGLSSAFAFAVAALIEGRVDAAWGRWVRPWTLAAWIFLTIGIALGSWWAYYELGWGGFWFWDPVENASFMPWLFAAALLHSAIVVEKRESLKLWTILLAILAFGFSLLGTFIVRSGILTSVHAFANDPDRGFVILGILTFFFGGALVLFAFRDPQLSSKGVFAVVSRESSLIANNLLLAVGSFVVFLGTVWPLIAEMVSGRVLSVGPPFFNAAFLPFMVLLGIILPIGSHIPWKRGKLGRSIRKFIPLALFVFACAGLVWAMSEDRSLLGPVGVMLGLWISLGAVFDFATRSGKFSIRRMIKAPRAEWGKCLAHTGLGITMFAIAGLSAWEQEDIRAAQIGERWTLGQFEFQLNAVETVQGPNYMAERADITVYQDGALLTTLLPEKRFYPVAEMPTTEAAIDYRFSRDLYVVLGDAQEAGGFSVRTYIKPFTNWIWFGCLLMAFAGVMSLTDRRFRVGASARKDGAAPVGVAAE